MAKNEPQDVDTVETGDAPLIDLNDASVKKLLAKAKRRGYITVDELNEALPQDQMNTCLLYTSPSPRDRTRSRMPSSA